VSDGEEGDHFYTGTSCVVTGDPYATDSSFEGFEGFSDGGMTEDTSTVETSIYDSRTSIYDSRTKADILGEVEKRKVVGNRGSPDDEVEQRGGGGGGKAKGKERGIMDSAGSIGRFRSKLGKLISGKIEGLVSGRDTYAEAIQPAVQPAVHTAVQTVVPVATVAEVADIAPVDSCLAQYQQQKGKDGVSGRTVESGVFDNSAGPVVIVREASGSTTSTTRSTSSSSSRYSSGTLGVSSSSNAGSGASAKPIDHERLLEGKRGKATAAAGEDAGVADVAAAAAGSDLSSLESGYVRRKGKGHMLQRFLAATAPLEHISEGSASAGVTPRGSLEVDVAGTVAGQTPLHIPAAERAIPAVAAAVQAAAGTAEIQVGAGVAGAARPARAAAAVAAAGTAATHGFPYPAVLPPIAPAPAGPAEGLTEPPPAPFALGAAPATWDLPPFSSVYGPAVAADRARADAAAFLAAAAAAATAPTSAASSSALMHQVHHPVTPPAAAASAAAFPTVAGAVQISRPAIQMLPLPLQGVASQQLPTPSLSGGTGSNPLLVPTQPPRQVQMHGEETLAMLMRDTMQCIRDTEAYR
jgi:hypothetical protein